MASGLSSKQARSSEVYNILPEDIQRVVKQATRKVKTTKGHMECARMNLWEIKLFLGKEILVFQ